MQQEQTIPQLFVDTHGEVQQPVISKLVVVNAVVCGDIFHQTAVDGEQHRPKHRPMRNAVLELHN